MLEKTFKNFGLTTEITDQNTLNESIARFKEQNITLRGVIDYANDELNKVDMIMVMGKDESADFFMNSTAQFIISASKQPVLCVPLRKSGMSLTAIF